MTDAEIADLIDARIREAFDRFARLHLDAMIEALNQPLEPSGDSDVR